MPPFLPALKNSFKNRSPQCIVTMVMVGLMKIGLCSRLVIIKPRWTQNNLFSDLSKVEAMESYSVFLISTDQIPEAQHWILSGSSKKAGCLYPVHRKRLFRPFPMMMPQLRL